MDPMEYLLHSDPARPTSQDATGGHASSWTVPPLAGVQPFPWSSHPNYMASGIPSAPPPPLPSHLLPGPGSGSFFHARPGGLPPPLNHAPRGIPPQDPFMPPRQWNSSLRQTSAPIPSVVAPPPPQMGPGNAETTFAAGARSLNFQLPAGPGLAVPGATSDRQSLPPRWSLSSPEPGSNTPGQPNTSHFDLSTSPAFPSTPPQPTIPFSTHRRHSRSEVVTAPFPPTPTASGFTILPSPTSDRRRAGHTRARRSMAARLTGSDPYGDDHEGLASRTGHETSSGHSRRGAHSVSNPPLEEAALREMQVLRGAATIKMVASRKTLQSLESVKIEDLPTSERTCVICYNEFGAETPEGIQETPLRLPGCKHVFGDHCIKKWFQDSDSCPYCRDKLHSEPKHHHGNGTRAFMNMMRLRGSSASSPEEFIMRVISPASTHPLHTEASAGRRSPPGDDDEPQRRTRPRRSVSGPHVPISPSRAGTRRGAYIQSSVAGPDVYSTQESVSRHLFMATHHTSMHRRVGTTSGTQLAAGGRSEQISGQPNTRYSIQSISMSQDGFESGGDFPAAADTLPPDVLQTTSVEAERNGAFGPQDTRAELEDDFRLRSALVRHMVGTGSDEPDSHRADYW